MKIILKNKTHWRDDHIRAFVARGLKEERPDLCKRGAPAIEVVVASTRTRVSSGCAYYHRNWFTIRIRKDGPLDKAAIAHTIFHELAHTRGVKHINMMHTKAYGYVQGWRVHYAWANDLPLEAKPAKTKKNAGPDTKLAHAEKMLRAALTREKRAVTLRRKWQQKVGYYSRRLEKAGMLVDTTPQQ